MSDSWHFRVEAEHGVTYPMPRPRDVHDFNDEDPEQLLEWGKSCMPPCARLKWWRWDDSYMRWECQYERDLKTCVVPPEIRVYVIDKCRCIGELVSVIEWAWTKHMESTKQQPPSSLADLPNIVHTPPAAPPPVGVVEEKKERKSKA